MADDTLVCGNDTATVVEHEGEGSNQFVIRFAPNARAEGKTDGELTRASLRWESAQPLTELMTRLIHLINDRGRVPAMSGSSYADQLDHVVPAATVAIDFSNVDRMAPELAGPLVQFRNALQNIAVRATPNEMRPVEIGPGLSENNRLFFVDVQQKVAGTFGLDHLDKRLGRDKFVTKLGTAWEQSAGGFKSTGQ